MWFKKMRHKRLQLFLIGLVLCVSADTYEEWGYLELVDGLNGTQPPEDGEIWISETIAVPNGIVLGEEIALLYDTPLVLKVTGFYRSTCFPKSFLGGIGIMATFIVFIVTMIIVGYIIKSSLVKEFKNIGIYKSLGYNSRQIVRIYMNGYLLVGIISITIGVFIVLPAVTFMGKVSTEFISGFALSSTTLIISVSSILLLMVILWINLKKSFKKVKTISPVEAITVGLTSSQKQLSPSVIKNAKSPMAMAINEMFKYKKSTGLLIVSVTACMYLSMLFGMIWYSSFSMIDNANLWFCLPKNDVYIAGTISDELITYLDHNQYVENMVYGDFSYKDEIKVEGYDNLVNYIRFDTYSDFSNDSTGIKLLEGDIPSLM